MAYTESHLYWTFHWNNSSVVEEEGQIGVRSSTPGTPPTLTTANAVSDAFGVFWAHTDAKITITMRYYRLKCALITPDGRYDPDFDPVVVDETPIGGSVPSSSGNRMPLQVAHSLQLTTDRDSGRAHAGRVYLPQLDVAMDGTYRWPIAAVNARAARFATFLTAMNSALGTENVQVMSSLGAGTTRTVTGVRADDRADVQRRRARQQPYVWGTTAGV